MDQEHGHASSQVPVGTTTAFAVLQVSSKTVDRCRM